MLSIGDKAPNINIKALDGQVHGLGPGLTLAIFFKTTCPTCQYAWPFYERLYRAYHEAGLDLLGISQHDLDQTRSYAAQYGSTFPLLVDEGYKVSKAFAPDFVPTGFLIDSHRNIVGAFASWNKQQYELLGQDIAGRLGAAPKTLILPGEEVVGFKPG